MGENMVTLVKTLMALRGTSQSELSKHTGISVTSLSRYLNEVSELRGDALIKVLNYLGADVQSSVKRVINKALGNEEDITIGDDIRLLLEHASPIARKTIADTLISSFKNEKNPDMKNRIHRLKKYKDSIKTVRRMPC